MKTPTAEKISKCVSCGKPSELKYENHDWCGSPECEVDICTAIVEVQESRIG